MKTLPIALAAFIAAAPVASDPIYDLGTMKDGSRQAFVMANSARVWAKATGNKDCMENAHEAMTRAADAALFSIRAIDSDEQDDEDRFIRHGRFNAYRSVKLSAICLPPNYKLPVFEVIPYELPELEEQSKP